MAFSFQIIQNGVEPAHLGPQDLDAAKAEIRRLQRELAAVEEEREILKKVLSIFSRTST